MGNNCVGSRVVSNDGCFHSITNSLWRSRATTDGVNPCSSGDGVLSESALVVIQHNRPEQIKVVKEETKSIKSKIVKGQTDSAQGKVVKEEVKPVHPSRPDQEPQTVKRVVSQIKYVLETKTGRLHEYYNLGRKLGQGQYGTTYLCVEKATGKKYACKSLMKKEHLTENDVVNVRNEIQILHHLSGHQHIIGIKDAYEDAVAVHVVMEFCAGGELFDRIKKRGHYTERKAAQLARTIVGSVEACHSLGVMHRDLKPENFLFLNEHEDSPLKTIDFGLSVFFKPGETFTEVVGSPTYVAPEVLSKCYGPEADVWSAGVIIYILLSGVPPFWGETKEKSFEQTLHGDLNLSSDPWPNISASAKDLVRRMLIRDPKKRITAPEVLCHPWVQVDEVDSAVLSRLKQFSAMNYLKKMALKI